MKKKIFITGAILVTLLFAASIGILIYSIKLTGENIRETGINHQETPSHVQSATSTGQQSPKNPIVDNKKQSGVKNSITPASQTPILNNFPANTKLDYQIINNNNLVKEYLRDFEVNFGKPDEYSVLEGVTCFRGNNYRNSASYGFADVTEQKLEKVWSKKIGYIDTWTGVGWNGQPSIVKWSIETKKIMNLNADKKVKDSLKEVIYATLDGKIYFLDLENGEATRPLINVGYPHKGSVTVDPRGYPLLYAGQGIDTKAGKRVPIGYRIFSLIDNKQLFFINGFDKLALRRWGAFDSTPLIDKENDLMVEPGENGILYTVKLNTDYKPEKGSISLKPYITGYRYKSPKKGTIGTENSASIYKNYAFFADNSGTFQCVDLNTLKPVWLRNVTDDTDSTSVIDEISESEVYLYTACEIDKQGSNGYCYIRKLNAFNGELIWERSYKCSYDGNTNGGALASPVSGKNDIQNLVIYNVAKTGKTKNSGKIVALDKSTGNEVWSIDLKNYGWSSPVDFYTKDGKSYIIACDSAGYMYLIEGITGTILDKLPLEANIEGSPAIYDNLIVVGTRGQKIWCIKVK